MNMHLAFNGAKRNATPRRNLTRLSWMSAGGSQAFQLLHGCPVVTVDGETIGRVDGLIIDSVTHKPRFVTLHHRNHTGASVAIPWHSLYFDSTLAHLVFYTYDDS
jgi:hypothetical protein